MLTKQQARKLMKGGAVQMRPDQLNLLPAFPADIQKQVERAMRQGKGMRLRFRPEHLVEGSGILDWLKSAASTVGSVLKPITQVAAPIAKIFAPAIAAKTGLDPSVISGIADVGSQLAGKGMKKKVVKQFQIADDSNTMMNTQHPVFGFQPILPAMDMSAAVRRTTGGGVMFDSKQFTNPFVPVVPNYTAGGSFKLAKGIKRGGSFKMA